MSRHKLEVAQLINLYQHQLLRHFPQPAPHLRTLQAISQCRTAALGGHIDACSDCGHLRISYNSCRNRHCPKCQGLNRHRWVHKRMEELLPVPYFHLVFTLPHQLNELALLQPRTIYQLLFHTAWHTIQTLGKDHKWLGAQMAMTAVLHTWGQNLQLHPHLHCIVPAGGITGQGKWKALPYAHKYLFPAKVLKQLFRNKFMARIKHLIKAGQIPVQLHNWKVLSHKLYRKKWVVFAKRPFAGPQQVIQYLGKYTHRIAISNQRLLSLDNTGIHFSYKDYRDGKRKVMCLKPVEFLRRFCLHILPSGFRRIRHYGFLSNAVKKEKLDLIRKALNATPPNKPKNKLSWQQLLQQATGYNVLQCPACKSFGMKTIGIIPQRRPPPANQIPSWFSVR